MGRQALAKSVPGYALEYGCTFLWRINRRKNSVPLLGPRSFLSAGGLLAFLLGGSLPVALALPYNPAQIEIEPVTAADRLTQGASPGATWTATAIWI